MSNWSAGCIWFYILTCIVHYIIIFILHNHPPLGLVRRLKSRQQERKVGSFFLESYLVTETTKPYISVCSSHKAFIWVTFMEMFIFHSTWQDKSPLTFICMEKNQLDIFQDPHLGLERHEGEEMMKYPINIYTNKLLGQGQSKPKDKGVFYTKFQRIITGVSNLSHI